MFQRADCQASPGDHLEGLDRFPQSKRGEERGKGHSSYLISHSTGGITFSFECACNRQSSSLIPGLAGGFPLGNELFLNPSEGLERGNGTGGVFVPHFLAGMTLFWRKCFVAAGNESRADLGLFEN
jgi:hypothetical protein